MERAFEAPGGIGFTWTALLGFIRIATRTGIFPKPLPLEDTLGVVDAWINHPSSRILNPGERHGLLLARLLVGVGHAGNLTTDAHLAAMAMEHGATLATFDRDFERFPGLSLEMLSENAVHERAGKYAT